MRKLKDQCEQCGCSPCDCGKGITETYSGYQNPVGIPVDLIDRGSNRWKAPEAAEKLMAAILRQGRRLPDSLKGATIEEVEEFFRNRLITV